MMVATVVLLLGVLAPDDPELARRAIDHARNVNHGELLAPYIFQGGMITIETPFLHVAMQAREAFDRHLPFLESQVDRKGFARDVTISAQSTRDSFKHIVIAVMPPPLPEAGPVAPPSPSPEPSSQPLTNEEIMRRDKEARKRNKGRDAQEAMRELLEKREEERMAASDAARLAWVKAEKEKTEAERARHAAAVINQPKTIKTTEHAWQNGFGAKHTTTGVQATFPPELLVPGNEIRAVLDDGIEVVAILTAERVATLR